MDEATYIETITEALDQAKALLLGEEREELQSLLADNGMEEATSVAITVKIDQAEDEIEVGTRFARAYKQKVSMRIPDPNQSKLPLD